MESNSKPMNENKISLHEYTVEDINGDSYDFSKLKGKKSWWSTQPQNVV